MPIRREAHITREMVEAEAMRLWREREMRLPARVRRMKPDDLDYANGTWAGMYATALANFREALPLDCVETPDILLGAIAPPSSKGG